MGRSPEQEPGPWARAVAAALKAKIDDRGWSIRELAANTEKSANYLSIRFRGEASFTLNDVDDFATVLGFDGAEFLASVRVPPPNVTELRRNDSGFLDDALKEQGYETAAGSDETQADEFE